jgi:uncharacterized protein (TIGR02001 family)
MKKVLLASLLATTFGVAHAEGLNGNFSLTSDYRFRGISQTQNAAAIQGGVDYTHASGFYAGNWNSSVSSQMYTNGSGMESDLYAGFKKTILGLTFDVGSYNYVYPRSTTGSVTDYDTKEVFAGVAYKELVSFKYSQSLSNYFGVANSKNSNYYQVDSKVPLAAGLSAVAHLGRTSVNHSSNLNYTDYNVGVVYDLKGWDIGGRFYTNTGMTKTAQAATTLNGQSLYKNAVVISASKSF